jgi:hypothetical protein
MCGSRLAQIGQQAGGAHSRAPLQPARGLRRQLTGYPGPPDTDGAGAATAAASGSGGAAPSSAASAIRPLSGASTAASAARPLAAASAASSGAAATPAGTAATSGAAATAAAPPGPGPCAASAIVCAPIAAPINEMPSTRTLATVLPATNIGLLLVSSVRSHQLSRPRFATSVVTTTACHSAPF